MSEFSAATRAAIYQSGDGRCIGCGRVDITAQHRRRRGMGGSRDPLISTPANGVPLCGSGTSGSHGWTEAHPTEARLLGWALDAWEDQLIAPYWTRYGWRRWTRDVSGFYAVEYVDESELDRLDQRHAAIEAYKARTGSYV